MTAESAGIIGIVIAQCAMFAQLLVQGKVKARESHLTAIKDGFDREQRRQDDELIRLRSELHEMRDSLKRCEEAEHKCQIEKAGLETRLLLLERFRNVAAADNPTGSTKDALPPPLEK